MRYFEKYSSRSSLARGAAFELPLPAFSTIIAMAT
jgi:hypothetical protein